MLPAESSSYASIRPQGPLFTRITAQLALLAVSDTEAGPAAAPAAALVAVAAAAAAAGPVVAAAAAAVAPAAAPV